MDKAVHQIKAGKASEKKAALLPNGQQHLSVPLREHPSILCLSSLRTHSMTGIEPSLFFLGWQPLCLHLETPDVLSVFLLQQVKELKKIQK